MADPLAYGLYTSNSIPAAPTLNIEPDENTIGEQQERARQDNAPAAATSSVEPDENPIPEQQDRARLENVPAPPTFSFEPDENPIGEQQKRAREENALSSAEKDDSLGSDSIASRRHALSQPMVFTGTPEPGSQPDTPGFHEGPNSGPTSGGTGRESALGSFSPGDHGTRLNSFASQDHDLPLRDEFLPSTTLGKAVFRSNTNPPWTVLAIVVKLELLPAIHLLSTPPLTMWRAKEARRQAHIARGLADAFRMGDATTGRCSYYIGVAEYIMAVINSGDKRILALESPLKWFEQASKAQHVFVEGEWAHFWPEVMHQVHLQEEQGSRDLRRFPPAQLSYPCPPTRGKQLGRERTASRSTFRAQANDARVAGMVGGSWDWIKNKIAEAKNGWFGPNGSQWGIANAIRGGGWNELYESPPGTGRSNELRDHHGLVYTKNQPYGLDPLVDSPENSPEGVWNWRDGEGENVPVNEDVREFLRFKQREERQNPPPRRPIDSAWFQLGQQEDADRDVVSFDEMFPRALPISSLQPGRGWKKGGLQITNWTSRDGKWSGSSRSSSGVAPLPAPKTPPEVVESTAPPGGEVESTTPKDTSPRSNPFLRSKGFEPKSTTPEGTPPADPFLTNSTTPSRRSTPISQLHPQDHHQHRRSQSYDPSPSFDTPTRRISLREKFFLPGLSIATDSRSNEALAEEGESPVFRPEGFGEEGSSGLRKGTVPKRSPGALAEEGVSPTSTKKDG